MHRPSVVEWKLAAAIAVLSLLIGCAEDSPSVPPPAPSNPLVAQSLLQAIASDTSGYDLFFGAFGIGDSLFAGDDDLLECFTASLTEELESLEAGVGIDGVTMKLGDAEIEGDILVIHVNNERGVSGALFYPSTDIDLIKLRSAVAALGVAESG